MLGVFAPDGPAGLELEPSAFGGGGRFPVQVRFQPVHPSGQVLSVPEAALGEVLRYRNASTRFDLLLRGRAVDKIVGIFSHRGTPIGGLSLGAPGAVPISPDLMGASAAVHGQPPLPPQQPPLPPQPQARQQPPLPPQPPPQLPPLPPETAPSVSAVERRQMPPLPPEPVSSAEAPAVAAAAPAPTEPDVSEEVENEAAASLGAAMGSLSIASGEAQPASAPPS